MLYWLPLPRGEGRGEGSFARRSRCNKTGMNDQVPTSERLASETFPPPLLLGEGRGGMMKSSPWNGQNGEERRQAFLWEREQRPEPLPPSTNGRCFTGSLSLGRGPGVRARSQGDGAEQNVRTHQLSIADNDGRTSGCVLTHPDFGTWTLEFASDAFGHTVCSGPDLFECLAELRRWLAVRGYKILCNGARVDTWASSIARRLVGEKSM